MLLFRRRRDRFTAANGSLLSGLLKDRRSALNRCDRENNGFTPRRSKKTGHLLDLTEDEVALLQRVPYRGSLPATVPTDPGCAAAENAIIP
jgi:hypothetical protein